MLEQDGADLEAAYARANGPYVAHAASNRDFVVMTVSDFEGTSPDLSEAEKHSLQQGLSDLREGKTRDAFESLAQVRAKYGV